MMKSAKLLNYDSAWAAVDSIQDDVTKKLVRNGLMRAVALFTTSDAKPSADFDLLFFVSVLLDLYSEQWREGIRRILDRTDIPWAADDDDEPKA